MTRALHAPEVTAPAATQAPIADVPLRVRCICGGTLLGSPLGTARCCVSCARITWVYGSRVAIVPLANARAWAKWNRLQAFGGEA